MVGIGVHERLFVARDGDVALPEQKVAVPQNDAPPSALSMQVPEQQGRPAAPLWQLWPGVAQP